MQDEKVLEIHFTVIRIDLTLLNCSLKMVKMVNCVSCIFDQATQKIVKRKRQTSGKRQMSGKRGIMNNTGPLGHMNQFNGNIYGCLQDTVLCSSGVTKKVRLQPCLKN